MEKDNKLYNILIIEDNPGDLMLVKEYLDEHILEACVTSALNFKQANIFLSENETSYDIIFLDLSLPDKSGELLVREILNLSKDIPVVILTGYTDMPFSIKSLEMGISDYLLKDTLTPFSLYKSIVYNIDQNKFILALEQSEKRYNDLFHLSPQPMWVYDSETLRFLDVNDAALKEYGFDYEEFLLMKIDDIKVELQSKGNSMELNSINEKQEIEKSFEFHKLKNGSVIDVQISSNELSYNDKKSKVALANNVTERNLYIKAIENQNTKLKEIAWIQSHIVRAPLARLMAIVNLLNDSETTLQEEQLFLFKEIINSANELDDIIKDISSRTDEVEIKNYK
ncbi:response regulator [Arenibacter sp. BSSL-BM3]|uniref:Response regulator n=1 Tax=Arenibacter arenosicollis TaxID=2762274 RepID=A0ABR7QQ93_9FLAO|nr:response regulator [Arenibacter arenosicollis]MBC8769366.1 response regulator [Arenibacter arenosicollis]